MEIYSGEIDYKIKQAKREAVEMVFERIENEYEIEWEEGNKYKSLLPVIFQDSWQSLKQEILKEIDK